MFCPPKPNNNEKCHIFVDPFKQINDRSPFSVPKQPSEVNKPFPQLQQNAYKPFSNQPFPQQTTNAFASIKPQPQNPQNQQHLQPQNNFPAQAPTLNQNLQHPINSFKPMNLLNQRNSSQITNQQQNINPFAQIAEESKPFVIPQSRLPPQQPQPQINRIQSLFGHSAVSHSNIDNQNLEINLFDCQNTQYIKPLQIQKSAQTVKITLKPLLPEQIYIEISTPQQIIQKYLVQNFRGSGMELLLNIEGNQ